MCVRLLLIRQDFTPRSVGIKAVFDEAHVVNGLGASEEAQMLRSDFDWMFAVTLKTFHEDKVKAQRRMLAKVHEKFAYTRNKKGVNECQYLVDIFKNCAHLTSRLKCRA